MPPFRNCDGVAVSVSIDGVLFKRGILKFITVLLIILVLYELVFVMVPNMFHRIITLIYRHLLLLNFLNGLRLGYMYICITVSITQNFMHIHGSHLLLLLSFCRKTTSFICINTVDLQFPRQSSDKPVIIRKRFFNLPYLLMLIKLRSLSPFGSLHSVFLTKVYLLFLL